MGDTIPVLVPDIGTYKNVEIIEVLVSPGTRIKKEDPIITLESDKATLEIPSPLGGVVDMVKIKVGDRISQGDLILLLKVDPSPQTSQVDKVTPEPPAEPEIAAVKKTLPVEQQIAKSPMPMELPASSSPEEAETKEIYAGPATRKFARELGVALDKVKGSGRKGRVIKEDVQQYVKTRMTADKGIGLRLPEIQEHDFGKFGAIERVALSRIQRISGPRLHKNWLGIPHVTQFDEADITEVENFRKEIKEEASHEGVKLTILPFILLACVSALKKFPFLMASLASDGEHLILKKYCHIGIAIDTEQGLVVPVIKDADKKNLFQLAREIGELSVTAKENKLKPDQIEGGCFSISSLGGIGGTAFTPIINAPEVAILGVSKAMIRPVFHEGQVLPRLILPLSLSYDHRVVDGASAVRFTNFLSHTLSDIRRILL